MSLYGSPTSDEFFKNAQKAFLDTLGPKDRAAFSACSSSDELIKSLKELECQTKRIQKRSITQCQAVFKKLNDKLQPYFDALNVLGGADTTSAIAYGAFRVVLQLASGFPTFFEKLLGVLDRLARSFPQYDAIVKLFEGTPPPRMRRHLESVYQDLFGFLQIAARIFTASSGKVKRPLGMISSVIWSPFDARFGDLLARMDDHRKFIMDELEILQAEHAKDSERAAAIERSRAEHERRKAVADREKANKLETTTQEMKRMMEKEAKELSRRRLLEWLAPPSFADALESVEREEGTAQWIFHDQAYEEWMATSPLIQEDHKWTKMPPWVLWVHGNPGCGKTVLASSVIEKAINDGDGGSGTTCYFFFKYNDLKSASIEAAYRSILAQILHQNRHDIDLLDKFLFSGSDELVPSASGQRTATPKELVDLIRLCANGLGHITLVLDAIDESNEPYRVVHKLKDLATTAPIKLMCFSRPNVNSLQTLVPPPRQVKFDRNLVKPDIKTFLVHSLRDLVDEGRLPRSVGNIDALAEILVYGADGMFLWAKLMVKYLNSTALTPTSRLRTIQDVHFPEGLDTMYDRIAVLVSQMDAAERDLARHVLLWLHYTTDNFRGHETLQAAVRDVDDSETKGDFASAVISACGGLIESTPAGFQYVHLTAREYLASQSWARVGMAISLIPDPPTAAVEITTRCLQRLLDQAPTQVPSKIDRCRGRLGFIEQVEFSRSFNFYTARHWVDHLVSTNLHLPTSIHKESNEAPRGGKLLDTLSLFARNPLAIAFWIETLYTGFGLVEGITEQLEDWSNKAVSLDVAVNSNLQKLQQLAGRLLAVAREIRQIHLEWAPKLLETPDLIWDDVLAFQEDGILSELPYAPTTAVVLAPDAPRGNDGTKVPRLCTISSTSSDGNVVGVLSIYPCSGFTSFWRTLDIATAFYRDVERFSAGWIARYEVWSADSTTRMAGCDIPLSESEILLLLRQSFREGTSKPPEPAGLNDTRSEGQDSERFDERLETSFPTAIGHDCRTFAILRTVYNIRPSASGTDSLLRSFLLPLQQLDYSGSKWTSQLATFDPGELTPFPVVFRAAWRDWYAYRVSFSPDGKYLAFADYQKPCITQLAVFEISDGTNFGSRLVRSSMVRLGLPRVSDLRFHPQQTPLAFLSERKVWVWDFLHENSKPEHLRTPLDKCYISNAYTLRVSLAPRNENECKDHQRCRTDCIIKSVTFSRCGEYLLAKNKNEVEVLRVPQGMIKPRPQRRIMETPYPGSNKGAAEPALFGSGKLAKFEVSHLQPGEVISEVHLCPTSGQGYAKRALVIGTTENNIRLGSMGAYSTTSQVHLLSLPRSFSLQNTGISLRVPTASDDSLTIMLNQPSAESYSLSKGREGQVPTIVKRKLTSVMHVTEAKNGIEWSGYEQTQKRLRGME